MRDAPGDVGPGRGPLREHELGDVVDGDDVAVLRLGGLLAGDAHREISLLAAAADRHLALDEPLIAVARGLKNLGKLGRHVSERPAERLAFGAGDQPFGGAVEDGDAPVGVDDR